MSFLIDRMDLLDTLKKANEEYEAESHSNDSECFGAFYEGVFSAMNKVFRIADHLPVIEDNHMYAIISITTIDGKIYTNFLNNDGCFSSSADIMIYKYRATAESLLEFLKQTNPGKVYRIVII